MKTILKVCVLLTILMTGVFTISCDKSDDEDKTTKTELQGTWERTRTETYSGDDYTYTEYIVERIVVDGEQLRHEVLLHTDNMMSTVTIRNKKYYSFIIGEETASGKKLDLILSKITLTAETQGWCDTNNKLKWYSFTDWAVGEEKDITGKCSQENNCLVQQPAAGTEYFTIFNTDGTNLSINTSLSESAGSRPTTFDTSVFVKQ